MLLALGICHLLLIWNGDILTLYAVCGLIVIPFLRLPARWLALLGGTVILLPYFIDLPIPFPSQQSLRTQAALATQAYREDGFMEILKFRWHETGPFIVPLLLSVLPQTCGLMLCGAAAWRSGLAREPEWNRRLLKAIYGVGLLIGATGTAINVSLSATGRHSSLPSVFHIPLAFSYAAIVMLWVSRPRTGKLTPLFAAGGQMALTNYLAQSLILGIIFYCYGFGLFGKLGSASAAVIGIALYAGQLLLSRAWLRHYRFGPAEWLWRSMTYGRWQAISTEVPAS